jgi:HAD superfamily hydrolase (TIGR01450 family)
VGKAQGRRETRGSRAGGSRRRATAGAAGPGEAPRRTQGGAGFIPWLEEHRGELDALALDIDGVLLVGRELNPGARELLAILRRQGMPVSLLTNDANNSIAQKLGHLRDHGLRFHPEEVTSSGHALAEVVAEHRLQGELFFVLGRLGRYAQLAGLRVTRSLQRLPACRGVIVGEEEYDWESTLNGVSNYFVCRPEGLLIVPNPDPYFPIPGGGIQIAAGGVARLLEFVLGEYGLKKDALFLGKPNEPIFRCHHHMLQRRLGRRVDRSRVMLLGDSLRGDIAGAQRFGYRNALLLTGVTTPARLAQSPIRPELVFRAL